MAPTSANILELLSTAVIEVDPKLRIVLVNAAAEDLLQIGRDRLVGQPLPAVLPLSKAIITRCHKALLTDQAFTQRREQFQLTFERSITLDYTVTPLMNADRMNADGMNADGLVFEMLGLDRILRISQDEKHFNEMETTRKLVRGLAHEIKNPLGGIRGAAQLLERELTTEDLKDYTQVIISETDRLVTLIDKMIGPGQLPNYTATNIHQLLERVVQLVSAEAAGALPVVRNYDVSLPMLTLDADQIHQALLNIMRNAYQALSGTTNPTITVSTSVQRQFTIGNTRHRQVVVVRIQDNGPGIPQELTDRIFYPMITGRSDGTGLGLSIAQAIVGQHGGLLEANSVPGETTFSLYLPISPKKEKDVLNEV